MTFKDFMQMVVFAAACVYLYDKAANIRAIKTPVAQQPIDDTDDDLDSLDRQFKCRGKQIL